MNEAQLIAGCKENKRECQKYLYEKYAPIMYGVCLRYTSNGEAAQDLLHDGFIKVFSVIRSYSAKGSFEGWMKRIFINLALEKIRKEKMAFGTEDVQNIPDIYNDDIEETEDISEEILLEMIQELPRGYKMVFNLYAIEGLSHKEVAEILNIAEGTSRSQYIRARQILQEKVVEYIKKNK